MKTSRAANLREVFTYLLAEEGQDECQARGSRSSTRWTKLSIHVRGPVTAALVVEYGDYECPYSRGAFRAIERVEAQVGEGIRFAFRHFPLTEIHPHALAASRAAEAAALQGRFWEMHNMLFHRQEALGDDDLRRYAIELGLDVARFDSDRRGEAVLERVRRDVRSGIASGDVRGTPTLFINGVLHRAGYDAATLLAVLAR